MARVADKAAWLRIAVVLLALVAVGMPGEVGSAAGTPVGVAPTGFVAAQIAQMTTPSSPDFDSYLAGRLRGHALSDLRVFTTFNPALQQAAQQIVSEQVRTLSHWNITDGALVAIDLRENCYGCILSLVGTAGGKGPGRFIDMANVPREPGSSFIPFTYLAGFERGLSPATQVLDAPIRIPDPYGVYAPVNFDHRFHGRVSLRRALGNSYNVPTVKVELWTGVKRIADAAQRLGVRDLRQTNPHCCGASLTLGGLERGVTLVQETAAYGAIARNGMGIFPISFTWVADGSTGAILWRASQDPFLRQQRRREVPAAPAYMVTSILSDNAARAQQFGPDSPLALSRSAAAKTGTTNAFTDNWTEGYTPQIVTGVWVGNADNSPMVGATGITGAVPIWHMFMERAFGVLKLPARRFPWPAGLRLGRQCRSAGGTYSSFAAPSLRPAGTTPYCSLPG